MDILIIFAILLSPIIAIWIGQSINNKNNKENAQKYIFYTLMSNRHDPLNPDYVKALNSIDFYFHHNNKVRDAWKLLLETLNNPASFATEHGPVEIKNRQYELLKEISSSLKLTKISEIDINNFWAPIGPAERAVLSLEISRELNRVLKNTSKIHTELFEPEGIIPELKEASLNIHPHNDLSKITEISGTVESDLPSEFKIATFLRVNGLWHNKPSRGTPTVDVNERGEWKVNLYPWTDFMADSVRVDLLMKSDVPPDLSPFGSNSIPNYITITTDNSNQIELEGLSEDDAKARARDLGQDVADG